MPTFDFRCTKCAAVFESAIPFGSKKRPPCPACKHKKTEKLLSAPGIVFKGSGFYKTDASKSTVKTEPKETPKPSEFSDQPPKKTSTEKKKP